MPRLFAQALHATRALQRFLRQAPQLHIQRRPAPASAKVWSCGALLWPTASNTSRSRPCRPCARLARLLKTWSLAEKNGHLDKNMWDKQKMASFHRLDFELVVKVANQRGRSLNMPQEKSLKGLPIQPELKIGIFSSARVTSASFKHF